MASWTCQELTWEQENLYCGDATSCSASVTKGKTYNVGFQFTITPYKWISAGFNVGMAWSTSEGYSCVGETGKKICVWHKTIFTDYTVTNDDMLTCEFGGSTDKSEPFVVRSPNIVQIEEDNSTPGYYCVVDTCRGNGQWHWITGRPGGPPGGP